MARWTAWLAAFVLAACVAPPPDPEPLPPELLTTVERLYAAFDFDPGGEPDWDTQRAIYLESAAFVPSLRAGRMPATQTVDEFLADFRAFARSEPTRSTGFHERVLSITGDHFGGMAHVFVAFEGFVAPDGEATTRGLDSIQFVHDGEAWRLASFATQFASDGAELPRRFAE